jgi:hypothetical protein
VGEEHGTTQQRAHKTIEIVWTRFGYRSNVRMQRGPGGGRDNRDNRDGRDSSRDSGDHRDGRAGDQFGNGDFPSSFDGKFEEPPPNAGFENPYSSSYDQDKDDSAFNNGTDFFQESSDDGHKAPRQHSPHANRTRQHPHGNKDDIADLDYNPQSSDPRSQQRQQQQQQIEEMMRQYSKNCLMVGVVSGVNGLFLGTVFGLGTGAVTGASGLEQLIMWFGVIG